jgi:hypothetical protein
MPRADFTRMRDVFLTGALSDSGVPVPELVGWRTWRFAEYHATVTRVESPQLTPSRRGNAPSRGGVTPRGAHDRVELRREDPGEIVQDAHLAVGPVARVRVDHTQRSHGVIV